MANEEPLKILKQGVEQWNKWRLENARRLANAIRPDLGYADAIGAFLSSPDLTFADLSGAALPCSSCPVGEKIRRATECAHRHGK